MQDPSERTRARYDFQKARTRAFFNEIFSSLFRKNNELFQFDEVKQLVSPHGMQYRGLQSIPIDKIVGSEGRYQDFDRDFMPISDTVQLRWENLDLASRQNVTLPPISVYKIGEFYFVRDGNHRVSVAKQRGQDFIDAEVVELYTKVPLEHMTEKDLLIADSYHEFLNFTHIDRVVPRAEFKLTNPWGFYRLMEHVQTFHYLISEKEKKPIPWEEGVRRWYHELYAPVVKTIKQKRILKRFPGREAGDLYIWVMDHWHFLKEKFGNIPIEDALDDYSAHFGLSPFRQFLGRLSRRFGSGDQGGKS